MATLPKPAKLLLIGSALLLLLLALLLVRPHEFCAALNSATPSSDGIKAARPTLVTETTTDEGRWTRRCRLKVVQCGVAYAAAAGDFLQGLACVSTLLRWPEQLQKLTGLALLIGLPVVLVLAWFHGDRGHRRVTRTELAILTLLFLLGGGIFWRHEHASEIAR